MHRSLDYFLEEWIIAVEIWMPYLQCSKFDIAQTC